MWLRLRGHGTSSWACRYEMTAATAATAATARTVVILMSRSVIGSDLFAVAGPEADSHKVWCRAVRLRSAGCRWQIWADWSSASRSDDLTVAIAAPGRQ